MSELVKAYSNGQWTTDETLIKATHEKVAGPTEETLDRANKLKEMNDPAKHRVIPQDHMPQPGESQKDHRTRVGAHIKKRFPNSSPDQHLNAANAAWDHYHGEE